MATRLGQLARGLELSLKFKNVAAAAVLAWLLAACQQSGVQASGPPPLYQLSASIGSSERPHDGVTILGTYAPEGATLVAWTTASGITCFGDVSPAAPSGRYTCDNSWPGPSSKPAFPFKPVFWPTPSHIIGFGLVTGPVSEVAITMNGVTIHAQAIQLKGQSELEGYAFPVPHGPANSTRISLVVGRDKSGTVVAQLQ